MSELEELRAVEERIAARLGELQPVVEEYEELQRAAQRLGIDVQALRKRHGGRDGVPRDAPSSDARAARDARSARDRPASRRRRRPEPVRVADEATAAQPGGTRAKGAERRQQVIALIRERPGITVPDVSRELGLEPPPVYRVIRKLLAAGVVVKDGKRLRLA